MHIFNIKPDAIETVSPALHPPNEPNMFTMEIVETRDESKENDLENLSDTRVYYVSRLRL